MEKKSIKDYRESIERLAKTSSEFVFDNSGKNHAAIVLSMIFKYSEETVRIYANNMNGEISYQECYKDSIDDFINSNKKLMIAIDEKDKLSDTIKQYLNTSNPKVEIKIVNDEFRNDLRKAAKDTKLHHFAIGDNRMVRIELDSKDHKALCSFNLPDTSNRLIEIFDRHYRNFQAINA